MKALDEITNEAVLPNNKQRLRVVDPFEDKEGYPPVYVKACGCASEKTLKEIQLQNGYRKALGEYFKATELCENPGAWMIASALGINVIFRAFYRMFSK